MKSKRDKLHKIIGGEKGQFSDDSSEWVELTFPKGDKQYSITFSFEENELTGIELWEADVVVTEENHKLLGRI